MNMIKRTIADQIKPRLFKGKAIVIFGARQVGKTTLVRTFREEYRDESIYFNCDEPDVRSSFTNATSTHLNQVTGDRKLVIMDEAQRIENIGITLKLLVDNYPQKQLLVTGSSSFDLSNRINEPLTGRMFEFRLHPLSIEETRNHFGELENRRMLEQQMIYGMYPEAVHRFESAREILMNITSGYLYKDIFNWQDIRKPELLEKLLKALALQISHQVSYNELATLLEVRRETIVSYLQLLEKVFVIFRLQTFSRNLRNELNKKQKIYFWDTGVRNTIIGNFSPLENRPDTGALWENFIISERLKFLSNKRDYSNTYYWRTQQQQEIDYIEERDGLIKAHEFKWNINKKVNFPKTFTNTYTEAQCQVITPENYIDFVSDRTN